MLRTFCTSYVLSLLDEKSEDILPEEFGNKLSDDLNVKIADLGNACWTVCFMRNFALQFFKFNSNAIQILLHNNNNK